MDWKEILKSSAILCALLLILGICYAVIFGFIRHNNLAWLWATMVVALVIMPLIYSFITKKNLKESAAIAILFIVLSSAIFIPLKIISTNNVIASKGRYPVALFTSIAFGVNPISLIESPICIPFIAGNINSAPNTPVAVCPIQQFGLFVELVLLAIVSMIAVYMSMIAGYYLSTLRKTS